MDVLVTAERVEVAPPRRATDGPDTVGTTVTAVLRDPRAFDGWLVEVSGRAWPSARGFVLSADGRDIFVSAPARQLESLSDGERARIEAKVQRLSGLGADTLERAVTTDPPGDQPGNPPVLERLPIDSGDPYLLFRELRARM